MKFGDTGELEFGEDFLKLGIVVVPEYESPIGVCPAAIFGEVSLKGGLDAGDVHQDFSKYKFLMSDQGLDRIIGDG